MAKATNPNTEGNDVLDDFEFSDEQEFFGVKSNTLAQPNIIKQVKQTVSEEDDGDDEGGVTSLEEESQKARKKADDNPPAPRTKSNKEASTKTSTKKKEEDDNEDEEEEPEEDHKFFNENEKETTKAKPKEVVKTTSKNKKEEEVNDEEDDKEEDEINEEDLYDDLAHDLKDEGIFSSVDLPKDEKVTKEKFFELHDAEIEARVEETFEAFFKEMDEEGKAFLKFKKEGGNTKVFLNTYGRSLDIEEFDEANPTQVNKVLRHYISQYLTPTDDEEIEDQIKYLQDSGKDKATAKKYYNIIIKDDKDQKEKIQKIQESNRKKKEDAAKEWEEEFSSYLGKTDKIGEIFTLTKAEQKELNTFINKPTVKIGANKFSPQLNVEINRILNGEKDKDKEDLILLAKIIKDKFKFPSVITKVKTEVTKEAKTRLEQSRNGVRPATAGGFARKSLADFIE